MIPEPRGIVALQVRRYAKDYHVVSFGGAMEASSKNVENFKTYLLIRNGTQVHRLISALNFRPMLIPLRDEFNKPITKNSRHNFRTGRDDPGEVITRDDVQFDDYAEPVKAKMKNFNRIFFLMQGLLDRTKVFHPHGDIDMSAVDYEKGMIRLVRDEEDAIDDPSNLASFTKYRDDINAKIKPGDLVYVVCMKNPEDDGHYGYERNPHARPTPPKRGWEAAKMPKLCLVTRVAKDRSEVTCSWPWGKSWREDPIYVGKSEQTVYKLQHEPVEMQDCFRAAGYKKGDFLTFLHDRRQKGQYLKWAPQLLTLETLDVEAMTAFRKAQNDAKDIDLPVPKGLKYSDL